MRDWTKKLAKDLKVVGLINVQFCVQDGQVSMTPLPPPNPVHEFPQPHSKLLQQCPWQTIGIRTCEPNVLRLFAELSTLAHDRARWQDRNFLRMLAVSRSCPHTTCVCIVLSAVLGMW